MGNGNSPTPEFRREAVRLALTSGRTRRRSQICARAKLCKGNGKKRSSERMATERAFI